eukprot:10599007-Alexandrium_andersonii.AAC.1
MVTCRLRGAQQSSWQQVNEIVWDHRPTVTMRAEAAEHNIRRADASHLRSLTLWRYCRHRDTALQ